MATERVAVVTGANRGLGLETARQLAGRGVRVVLTARDGGTVERAAREIAAGGAAATAHALDVTDAASVERLAAHVRERFGRCDVLVNNAGIFVDPKPPAGPLDTPLDAVQRTLDVNLLGAYRVVQAIVPLMRTGGYGRVVNVSSGLGQLSDMGEGYAGYRMSKAALNALTRVLAAEVRKAGVLVNAVCPGWVRTDMGGPNADRSVEKGAEGIVWAAVLPDGGPTGGFFRDGRPIDW